MNFKGCFRFFRGIFCVVGSMYVMSTSDLRAEPPVIHWIKLFPVDSQAIRAIGYHHATKTLQVVFASGEAYRYANVPLQTFKNFMAAESKGHYFEKHIRGRFDYWKVSAK